MRKTVGFILVAMLLVPALAFAWTAGITVQGPAAGMGSNVVTIASPATTVSGGTVYVYPTAAQTSISATVALATGYSATVTQNGAVLATLTTPGATSYTIAKAAVTNFKVVYAAQTGAVNVNQTAGGLVRVAVGSASSGAGFSGVAVGSQVTTTANASDGYNVTKVLFDGYSSPSTTQPAKTMSLAKAMPASNVTAYARFTVKPYVIANVSAPATAAQGKTVIAYASAQSNDGSINYAFTAAGCNASPAAQAASSATSFSFIPGNTGICTVTVTASTTSASAPSKPAFVTVTAASAANICLGCHASSTPAVVAAFNTGTHNGNGTLYPAKNDCTVCHTDTPHSNAATGSCVGCHSVPQQANGAAGITAPTGGFVNDNAGVRAATLEFSKWSHHVTGVELNDAHCAACHLEGTVVSGKVVVDATKHMADNQIHLRNADNDNDILWNPAAANHTNMDNFCMSCHDGDGATSNISKAIQAVINANGIAAVGKTASATNPFGDTISNQYDKFERPAVVDAKGQFATTNNSHHAVLGKKYNKRSRLVGSDSRAMTAAEVATFTNNSGTSAGKLPGTRSTIYDAGRFESTYVTLADATPGEPAGHNGGTSLGDDSTLHCGDCHTVGQFRAADVNVLPFNRAVIGAHGSNNEYLLRNFEGSDKRHVGQQLTSAGAYISTGNYLVCFNCHAITKYGNGQGHDGERAGSEQCNGPYNTRSEPVEGLLNKISSLTPVATDYTGVGEDRLKSVITQVGGTTGGAWSAQTTGHGGMLGNIYGIQCANCHNSGVDNGYGGIHGSKVQTYKDGLGNTTKHMRFLPGLGNSMFVPGTKGGYTGTAAVTATYVKYSSNRAATPTYTALPVRNGLAFRKYSSISATNRQMVGIAPTTAAYGTAPATAKLGSFTYTTGGVTNDLNWEQLTAATDNGAISSTQGSSGCYTLSVPGTKRVNALAVNGYPADDVRYSPADGMEAPDGKEALDNWGGCEDHGGVAGASSEPFTRGIVRPVTY